MRDLITHSPDVTKLIAEVAAKLPDYLIRDENGNPVGFAVDKTPTVRKGNETLSVVRCSADEVKLLAALKSITVLANVAADGDLLSVMSQTGRATYDRIHDQAPYEVTLQDGTKQTITPAELIGALA